MTPLHDSRVTELQTAENLAVGSFAQGLGSGI